MKPFQIICAAFLFLTSTPLAFAQAVEAQSDETQKQVGETPKQDVLHEQVEEQDQDDESNACMDLTTNDKWNDGLIRLSDRIQKGEFEEAKAEADELAKMCARSPSLNYMQGRIAEGLNDPDTAKLYFEKASYNSLEFATASNLTKKIWYARYEAEHPEISEKSIQAFHAQIDTLTTQNSEKQAQIDYQEQRFEDTARVATECNDHSNAIGLWTGIGFGIAGLALAGTGAGLVAANDAESEKTDSSGIKYYKTNTTYQAGMALLGSGIALTVAGAVAAGVFGYKITHAPDFFEVAIAPTSVSISMQF